ncbi:pyridoxal-phosphate dependent enzyme domain-containing protein [Ditylenchus destructor]|uniref:cystathionine beta-synthase n=1 Tax=Ditylenchus destructor TaxID=166010 RepID=A0AAD4MVP0_9BILA|nr:pyridoxal-phosphate dependent enzyme domain-containing protein [Ditylenchus destructor]
MSDLEKDHPLPYTEEALKECIWRDEYGTEDRFGRYVFAEYPRPNPKILNNVLDSIGRTPLVRLNRIPAAYGVNCNIYGKCEFLNAGGSVKDRVAFRMIELAEQTGRLRPGMTIVEPTSGNMGIGLALAAAVKGYKCVILMKEHMSKEKELLIRALGAEVIRIPDDVPFDGEESQMGMAFKTQKSIPNSVVLDQYLNCGNPMAHYEGTAEEILDALDGKVDMIVVGAGTGGSVIGISRKIKQRCPNCKIIGVDPENSKLSQPDAPGKGFMVEGIGHDFRPSFMDLAMVDSWEVVNDRDGFNMARRLHRYEGLLTGGSAGSILTAAMNAAKDLPPYANCVNARSENLWWLEKKPVKSSIERPLIIQSIAGAVGHTPIVRLTKIPEAEGIEAEILVKLEYLNPGGSLADRVACEMMKQADNGGLLPQMNGTVITSSIDGNLGISLAMLTAAIANHRGLRCVIAVPHTISREQEVVLKALGAVVVRIKCSLDAPVVEILELLQKACSRLQQRIANSVVLDQCSMETSNLMAHGEQIVEEILDACDGNLHAVVIGTTLCGTISGISRKLKERPSATKIIGVGLGSGISSTSENNDVESLADEWIDEEESFDVARRLIREEGILGGPESASVLCAALRYAKKHNLGKGDRVVAVLPDGLRSSMSKITEGDLWTETKSFRDYCEIQ